MSLGLLLADKRLFNQIVNEIEIVFDLRAVTDPQESLLYFTIEEMNN